MKMKLEHYLVSENVLEGIRANRTQPKDQADWEREREAGMVKSVSLSR